jgi:hypothetical protein
MVVIIMSNDGLYAMLLLVKISLQVIVYTGITALQMKYYTSFLRRDHAVFGATKSSMLNTLMQVCFYK